MNPLRHRIIRGQSRTADFLAPEKEKADRGMPACGGSGLEGLWIEAEMADQPTNQPWTAKSSVESTGGFKNSPGWRKLMIDGEESYPVGFWSVKKAGRGVLVKVGVSW